MTEETGLNGTRIVVIGGGSGIGLAVARKAVDAGAKVVIGGRSEQRLANAIGMLGSAASSYRVDTEDKSSIRTFFESVGTFHHLFIPAASYGVGPIDQIDDETAAESIPVQILGTILGST